MIISPIATMTIANAARWPPWIGAAGGDMLDPIEAGLRRRGLAGMGRRGRRNMLSVESARPWQAERHAPAARSDRIPSAAMADRQAGAAAAEVHPQARNEADAPVKSPCHRETSSAARAEPCYRRSCEHGRNLGGGQRLALEKRASDSLDNGPSRRNYVSRDDREIFQVSVCRLVRPVEAQRQIGGARVVALAMVGAP